jgi:hypothetical protein
VLWQVHDGVVLRAPRQEGLVIETNAPGTHLRFRYLHMNPKVVDEDGFFSGRACAQRRDYRQGQQFQRDAKPAPVIICISTCMCRPKTAGPW